jgi:hypothetical protein
MLTFASPGRSIVLTRRIYTAPLRFPSEVRRRGILQLSFGNLSLRAPANQFSVFSFQTGSLSEN